MSVSSYCGRAGGTPAHLIDECVRCIRLDPDVPLAVLAARIGVHPTGLRKRLAEIGVERRGRGPWRLPEDRPSSSDTGQSGVTKPTSAGTTRRDAPSDGFQQSTDWPMEDKEG